jgi:hypothetical protein
MDDWWIFAGLLNSSWPKMRLTSAPAPVIMLEGRAGENFNPIRDGD